MRRSTCRIVRVRRWVVPRAGDGLLNGSCPLQSTTRNYSCDVWLHLHGRSDVGIGTHIVAVLTLGETAVVKRRRIFRFKLQYRVVIRDGVFRIADDVVGTAAQRKG